ncbi:MAG: flagellar filament capping protein FliD [Clostridiaceae bacterium]
MAVNSLNSSTLRLTGLTSGLDTESIVKSLLEIDQLKVDKQFKAVTKLEWQGEAYRAVNLQLKNFREKYMRLSSSDNMLTSKAYNISKATLTTDTSAVKITAASGVTAGAYTINSIDQLASAASFSSTDKKLGADVNVNTKISDLAGMEFEETETAPAELDEEGNVVTPATVKRSFSFSINGAEFVFDADTTISNMISTVNASAKAGVTMSYSTLKQGFTVTGNTTGAGSAVNIENLTGNFFGENSAVGITGGEKSGQNAKLTIEGVEVERNSNNFTIDGITYLLKAESKNTEIKFEVERDVDAVVDKIASFIDAYNELITSLQGKLNETVYSTYEPLTDTERGQLTEKQAEQWEEKAKSGLLKGDSKLSSLISSLRSSFYTVVESAGKSAAEIGLTTGTYTDGAKIVVDKEKLRAALEKNPAQVTNLFTASSASEDGSESGAQSGGLITRLNNTMASYTSYVTAYTLDNNQRDLSAAETKMSDLEDWLSENEENYYKRFTVMETALAKLNSQTSWISALLGS